MFANKNHKEQLLIQFLKVIKQSKYASRSTAISNTTQWWLSSYNTKQPDAMQNYATQQIRNAASDITEHCDDRNERNIFLFIWSDSLCQMQGGVRANATRKDEVRQLEVMSNENN